MVFLTEFLGSAAQYIIMLAIATGCFCLGAAISKHKKKRAK